MNQRLTHKQATISFIIGLIMGIVPGALLYYGSILFPGTGGPGCCPPVPHYGTRSLFGGILFFVGAIYYLLTATLIIAILVVKTLRNLRPLCYGMVITLTLSLSFAQPLIGSWFWYGALFLVAVVLIIAGEKVWHGSKRRL